MRQAIWALAIVIALIAGFLIGSMLSGSGSGDPEAVAELQTRVATLEQEIDQLKGSSGASGPSGPQRVAVVRINELATRYQEENPQVKERLEREMTRLQTELQGVREKFQSGELTQAEAQLEVTRLQQDLQNLTLSVVAKPIQQAVSAVAQEGGYDAVFKLEDVVIYHEGAVFDDITQEVWTRLSSTP